MQNNSDKYIRQSKVNNSQEILTSIATGQTIATRERLTPEQVGLTSHGRRRTSGLRREEVAELAPSTVEKLKENALV